MGLFDGRQWWEKQRDEAIARLRAALDKPLPRTPDDLGTEFFDPWHDLMDGCVGAYNSEIDRLAVDVLKAVRDRTTFDLLQTERGLAAELFMHMLADWLCDYGTSPRGVSPANGLSPMWDELIQKWEVYAAVTWNESE